MSAVCAQCRAPIPETCRFELSGMHRGRYASVAFCSLACLTLYAVEVLVEAMTDPVASRNGTR
jgi:hypothetical protein